MKEKMREKLEQAKSNIFSIFFRERDNTLSKIEIGQEIDKVLKSVAIEGRVSVLQDFDNICKADAFVGFSETEWTAIKKFFEYNKQISGWDKEKEIKK